MRASLIPVAALLFGACHEPEQPRVPPGPINPTNDGVELAVERTDVIDASIVKEAGPILDASVVVLDTGARAQQ
jgi:hypothetical protein